MVGRRVWRVVLDFAGGMVEGCCEDEVVVFEMEMLVPLRRAGFEGGAIGVVRV